MKKFLSFISKSTLALCLTLHAAHAMERDMQIEENTNGRSPKSIMEYRNLAVLSYMNAEKVESLWKKRKYLLQALKTSRELSENFPDLGTVAN